MRRGEVLWAAPDPGVGHEQTGRRPVLVVSSNEALEIIPSVVTVVPLTTKERPWATRVSVAVDGDQRSLALPTWAICEQVRTISVERLQGRTGVVDRTTMEGVDQVLRYLLDLP
ncbi:MAG: type II toxin-antitoxin system PemK/MazF family toxin [Arachnia sp.]